MSKFAFSTALLAILICVCSFFYFESKSKLVYVDVNKLLEGYKRTQIEREAFNKKAAVLKANADSLVSDWQKELKAYEKERANMSQKELTLKQELLANKQQQVNNYRKVIQKQIQEEDRKVTQTVINDINDHVKAYGKKNNYNIIFGAGGNGNIMYASEASDLTDKILSQLNEAYKIP